MKAVTLKFVDVHRTKSLSVPNIYVTTFLDLKIIGDLDVLRKLKPRKYS